MDDIEAEFNIPVADDDSSDDEASHQSSRQRRIKRPTTPLVPSMCKEPQKETGFHKSTRLCLIAIRDAMLHHRWQDAAEYMSSYSQTLEDTTTNKQLLACEIIWRIGITILHQLPNAKAEDFNDLYEQTKNCGVKNYLKICLEHAFHLMIDGRFEDAKRQLSIAESWRYGKQSDCQAQEMKLIHAYSGFLDYFTWCAKKSTISDDADVGGHHEMHSYFRQASVTLREIIKQPGIWDPFVQSYVSMLEFYNDQEGACKVLKDYAYDKDFPPNPNAHVYLYQFLKRHDAPQEKLVRVLKILHSLVPSHELMLEYCSLLLHSEKDEDLKEALKVVMDLLDYTSWKSNLEAWNCLMRVVMLLQSKTLSYVLEKEWETRKDLWLAMHFRIYQARKDRAQSVELLLVKAKLIPIMTGRYLEYIKVAVPIRKDMTGGKKRKDTRKASKAKCGRRRRNVDGGDG